MWREILWRQRRRYPARLSYLLLGDGDGGAPAVEMPVVGRLLPKGWVTEEDEFLMFWVCNTSHAAYSMFTYPMAQIVGLLCV